MSKETLVFIIGVLIFFIPFLGVPREWKDWILMGTGVLLVGIGYALRRNAYFQSLGQENGDRQTSMFSESNTVQSSDTMETLEAIHKI